jgi:hypothetical protein
MSEPEPLGETPPTPKSVSTPESPAPTLASDPKRSARERYLLFVWMLLFLTIPTVIFFRSCLSSPREMVDAAGRAIEKAGNALATVVAAFNSGKVTTEFISYASTIHPTQRLQFSTLKQTEIFTRRDESTTAFGYITLPEIIVEARAPVEYTYYLDLNAAWKLVLQEGTIHVLAPRIRFNQPSIDVSAMTYEVRKGSVFRNTAESLEGLKQSISQLSRLKARENINLVRETGRRQTQEFVEKWLAREFSDGKTYPVKVFFDGEQLPPALKEGSTGTPVTAPLVRPPD